MKNKKSLKNLKQYRNKVRFQFYVVFRPKAQKLFFPIVFVIFSIACADHWYDNRGTWVFENVQAASVFEETESAGEAQSNPIGSGVDGIEAAETESSLAETSGGTQVSSVSGSAIEDKIRKAFPGEEDLAVAVAMCESRLDPTRIGDTHMEKWSYGLFQVNQTWHPYSKETLLNADENIKIAKQIRDKGGWNRWSCYSQGYYEKYL